MSKTIKLELYPINGKFLLNDISGAVEVEVSKEDFLYPNNLENIVDVCTSEILEIIERE